MTAYAAPMSDPTAVMGRRIGAYLIDAILMGIIVAAITVPYFNDKATEVPAALVDCSDPPPNTFCFESGDDAYVMSSDDVGGLYARAFGVSAVLGILNMVVLQSVTGASVGKLATGLRVVDGNTGEKAGAGKQFVRWLIGIFEIGCCFLVALITALSTKGHRRLGDMAAGTNVVATSSVGTPPMAPIAVAPGGWGAPPPPGAGYAPPGQAPGWAPPPTSPPPSGTQWGAPPAGQAPPPGADVPPPPGPLAGGVGEPQWDAARRAYIQYDQGAGAWMQFDAATQSWQPISQ